MQKPYIILYPSTGRCTRALRITCCTPAWRLSQAPGEGTPGQAEEPFRTAGSSNISEATPSETASKPVGIGGRIKRFFLGDKLDKERIKALGESCTGRSQKEICCNERTQTKG